MRDKVACTIESRMGVAVYEQYGLSEVIGPGVASQCGKAGGMHIWEDHFVPEIVDPQTDEHVPDGEIGELILSVPSKEAFPALRYRTRDLTRLIREPCPCGRTSARISKILGRTDDMLSVRGVNVFPSQIEHTVLAVEGLEPYYQIILRTRADHQDELHLRIEVADKASMKPAARAALEAPAFEVLQGDLGLSIVVELVAPGTIQRSMGKADRVFDHRLR